MEAKQNYPKGLFVMAAALLLLAGPALGGSGTEGASNAANKTSVAGSTIEIIGDASEGDSTTLTETVLSTTMRTSATQDLIFAVTMECALWSALATEGN